MTRFNNRKLIAAWALPVLMLGLMIGCSTDSPTAPQQVPAPPPGQPSAIWAMTVSVSPGSVEVGSTDPATVSVVVRRADNQLAPPSGTTFVLSASLGEFGTPGSGLGTVALVAINGRAQVLWFPGAVKGTVLFTAQLESSAGQTTAVITDILEEVVASFETQNSEDNLSVLFQDTSTGDPTDFLWDFGDGTTSTEQNPAHIFALPGDYVVTFTASKTGSSDTTSQIVSVNIDPDDQIEAGFVSTPEGLTVVFQDTSTGNPTRWSWNFGDGTQSSQQHPTKRYSREGSYVVTLKASNARSSDSVSETITVTEEEGDPPFITDITPNAGPAAGGQTVTITGTGFTNPLRVFFGGVLAQTVSVSSTRIVVVTPPGVLGTAPCNDNGVDPIGTKAADTAVDVLIESGTVSNHTAPGGYTYLAPLGAPCNGD
jgi:PKD repeat protein